MCKEDTNTVNKYLENIEKVLENADMHEKVIIRSSGEFEGMDERGRYESLIVEKEDVVQKLFQLVEQLKEYGELRGNRDSVCCANMCGKKKF